MEEPVEDDRRRHRGRDVGQVVERAVHPAPTELSEEQKGDDESETHLKGDGEQAVREGRRKRSPEGLGPGRILVKDVAVIPEAAEGALDDVPPEERDIEGVEGWKDLEDAEDDDDRREESIGPQVLTDAAAAARIPTRRALRPDLHRHVLR